MTLSRRILVTTWAAGALFSTGLAQSQTASTGSGQAYPNRPIRIVASEAGGGGDNLARLLAPALSAVLGQPAIVDNRGSVMMPQVVARSAPDGHTLMLANSSIWLAEYLERETSYRMTDFAPVSWVTSSPGILAVHPSLAVNSVKDLIALAKAKPGALNYASATPGNLTHLAPELFKLMAGVNMISVPYKGSGPGLIAAAAGEVQLIFGTTGAIVPMIKAGRLRAVAVTSGKPSALFPDLPTIAASGVPGYEVLAVNGVLAPARTPAATIDRLNRELDKAIRQPEIRDRILNTGVEPVGGAPAEFAARIKHSQEQMGRIIKATGIRGD